MTINRHEIEAAFEADRLFVRVGRDWWLGRKVHVWEAPDLPEGQWIIKVEAGPHRATGLITNSADRANTDREFRIVRSTS